VTTSSERGPAGTRNPPGVAGATTRALRPLADFLHTEAGAGIVLVAAAVVAIVWANSAWYESYFELWDTEAVVRVGDHVLALTLREWVNDAAMTVFFFVVGLEIKRELTQGELRDRRQAALPAVAAIGGMVVPAAFYLAFNAGDDGAHGWGIPIATDIAIVVGVVALLGSRVPSSLKLFLLALAIVDDIGAILVIAVFYSKDVQPEWLLVSAATIALTLALRRRVPYTGVYVALASLCWFAMHEAHVHPTLTGVVFGFLAPVTPRRTESWIDATELAEDPTPRAAIDIAQRARDTVSVVEWLEHRLHPWSAYVVVPVFALANAGIRIPTGDLGEMMSSPVTWGVVVGLVVGKTVGVSAATLIAVRAGLGRLPEGVTRRYLVGAAALAGIGFTVSLFVAELAFPGDPITGRDARLGVLVASMAAAVVGTLICLPGSFGRSAAGAPRSHDRRRPDEDVLLP
jgi:Na+:H+ antiporter, NhaA family